METDAAPSARSRAKDTYGIVPNLIDELAHHNPAAAVVYLDADQALMEGVLSPAEQQAVCLYLALVNESRYDAVVHSRMCLDVGVSPDDVHALLDGEAPEEPRLAALVEATQRVADERGWVDQEGVEALSAQGVDQGALYEIIALFGVKRFSGIVDHLSGLNTDEALESTEERFDDLPERPETVDVRRFFIG
jgi:alkylhydroperoxidase family enzyme